VRSGEATNTNFIVFGLTRPGLEPTIYCTRDERTSYPLHYRCGSNNSSNGFYYQLYVSMKWTKN